jgi:hypothetical protein
MQGLGSPFLQSHGLRLLIAAQDLIEAPTGSHEAFTAEARRLAEPDAGGLSCEDLLAAAAEVEVLRLLPRDPTLELMSPGSFHRLVLKQVHPDPDAPARRGFEALARRIGDDDACELFPILTFLAFILNDPCETFDSLVRMAELSAQPFKQLTAAQLIDWLGWADDYERCWDLVAAGEPVGTPYLVDPLRAAMRLHGRSELLEVLARPSSHLNALPEAQARAVQPPIIVFPRRDGGVHHHRNGVALDDVDWAQEALVNLGRYGAAERLTDNHSETNPSYCTHLGCPHHAVGLCNRWYLAPTTAQGHDDCSFPPVFAASAGMYPAEIVGRLS